MHGLPCSEGIHWNNYSKGVWSLQLKWFRDNITLGESHIYEPCNFSIILRFYVKKKKLSKNSKEKKRRKQSKPTKNPKSWQKFIGHIFSM